MTILYSAPSVFVVVILQLYLRLYFNDVRSFNYNNVGEG